MCACVCARACPSLARDQDVPFCSALLSPSEIPPVWTANGVFSHLSDCMGTDARTPSHTCTLSLIPEPEKHKRTQTGSFQGKEKKKKKIKPSISHPLPSWPYFQLTHTQNLWQKAEALCDCLWWSWLLHKPLPAPTCYKGPDSTAQQRGETEKEALGSQELPPPGRIAPSGVVSPAASVS